MGHPLLFCLLFHDYIQEEKCKYIYILAKRDHKDYQKQKDMNTETLLAIVILGSMLVLRFTPNERIKAMGDFYKKILPRLPLTDIFRQFRK